MTENEYLQQVAAQTGFQHYPLQGPWGRKSGSVIGPRDGYIVAIGFNHSRQGATITACPT